MTMTEIKMNAKAEMLSTITAFLEERGETCLRTGSAQIAIPMVLSNGEEAYFTVTVSIPSGHRASGSAPAMPYDGYAEAECYAADVAKHEKDKADRKAKAEKEKAAKEKKEG